MNNACPLAEGRADWPASSGLRRPMQMRPLLQLAAARARRRPAPGDLGARRPAPPTSRAPRSAAPRCGLAARSRRARRPPLPRAQAANFGGVRAAPSPPARRALPFIECLCRRPRPAPRPPAAARPPLPERAAAGRAPAGAFVSRAARAPRLLRSGARRAARPLSFLGSGSQRRSACQSLSGSGAPSLWTFSSGSCPFLELPRRPARLGGSRPERSGVRTPGWQDFGKTNFPVRKRRGPCGSSPLLPSMGPPLPSAPPVPPPSGPLRLQSARPARGHHRGRLGPLGRPPGLPVASGSLNPGKGGNGRAPMFLPPLSFPEGCGAEAPAGVGRGTGCPEAARLKVPSPRKSRLQPTVCYGFGGGGEGVAHVWADTLQRPTPRAPRTRTHYSPAVTRTRPRNRACTPTRSGAHALSPTPARVLHPRAAGWMCLGPAVTAPASLTSVSF